MSVRSLPCVANSPDICPHLPEKKNKSNKIEVISELLAEELKICPPLITENLEIVVPNYFLGKWLTEQITIKNKISA